MYKSAIVFFSVTSMVFLLTSCDGDCKDEQIEKAEWITTYITKRKDTLVAYSVTENKREYIKLYDEVKHSLTIQNNNTLYSGEFSLEVNYGFNDELGDDTRTQNFDTITIAPRASYTFSFYSQAGKYANYSSAYTILQTPVFISYDERKDELRTSNIMVNSCKENVEALREKYKMIIELYKSKNEIEQDGQEK